MIRIPKFDIEKCQAFFIPVLSGFDEFNFFVAKKTMVYGAMRRSNFASSYKFSFEKFKAYIENQGGKVFLDNAPEEQLYCISQCNLSELQDTLYGEKYPIFCSNYDFDNDIYVRAEH